MIVQLYIYNKKNADITTVDVKSAHGPIYCPKIEKSQWGDDNPSNAWPLSVK